MTKEKLEEKLTGICPNCKNEAEFKYMGFMRLLKDQESLHLYNCSSCKSTISLKGYLEQNPKPTASSQ